MWFSVWDSLMWWLWCVRANWHVRLNFLVHWWTIWNIRSDIILHRWTRCIRLRSWGFRSYTFIHRRFRHRHWFRSFTPIHRWFWWHIGSDIVSHSRPMISVRLPQFVFQVLFYHVISTVHRFYFRLRLWHVWFWLRNIWFVIYVWFLLRRFVRF